MRHLSKRKKKRYISFVKDKVTTLLYEKEQWKLKIIIVLGICKTKKKKNKEIHEQRELTLGKTSITLH